MTIVLLLVWLTRTAWQVNDDPRTSELRSLRQRVALLEASLQVTADALEASVSLTQKKKQLMLDNARTVLREDA